MQLWESRYRLAHVDREGKNILRFHIYLQINRLDERGMIVFYWSKGTVTLENELLSCKGITKIKIASAFLSDHGIEIIKKMADKYGIKREYIELFISQDFSTQEPHLLLEAALKVCTPYIVVKRIFHAKVYLLTGKENKLVFGSSNFTLGGFDKNVEFDQISTPTTDEVRNVSHFFEYLHNISMPVDEDRIEFFRKHAQEIAELQAAQKKLRVKMTAYDNSGDAFSPDEYDLSDLYFSYEDYETLFTRNEKLNNSDIMQRRKALQVKMLAIHKVVYPAIKKMGLSCHRNPEFITSTLVPSGFNRGRVSWVGVRYGKLPQELDVLNAGREREDKLTGFQKHGCLQFCIVQSGFEINLFLAVRNDAWDRYFLQEELEKPNRRAAIVAELEALKGYGYYWNIYNDITGDHYFYLDEQDSNDFPRYILENDEDGCESYLAIFYEPNDPVLENTHTLREEIIYRAEQLLPLYNKVVRRYI